MPDEKRDPHWVPEGQLVGALIALPQYAAEIFGLVSPEDIARPSCRVAFTTAQDLHNRGVRCDTDAVIAELTTTGMLKAAGGAVAVIELAAEAGGAWAGWAAEVLRLSHLRRLASSAFTALEATRQPAADPGAIAERLAADATAAAHSAGVVPTGELFTFGDFIRRPATASSDWVIPGLLRRGWRGMVIAGEGIGKMVLFRQLAIAAAQGIHPLAFNHIDPIRTLLVDLENPPEAITETAARMAKQARDRSRSFDDERAHIWHREQGVNLCSRPGRDSFEAVLAATRPDAVFFGPLYKAFRYGGKVSEEEAVGELMAVFDDLRKRYGFALMLEHHAPKASGGERRTLTPFGTSLWMRWCEMGITLREDTKDRGTLKVARFRKDRSLSSWPETLTRSTGWPFEASWPDGTFDRTVPNREDEPF